MESPPIKLKYANPDSKDQKTWTAEARDEQAQIAALFRDIMFSLALSFYPLLSEFYKTNTQSISE